MDFIRTYNDIMADADVRKHLELFPGKHPPHRVVWVAENKKSCFRRNRFFEAVKIELPAVFVLHEGKSDQIAPGMSGCGQKRWIDRNRRHDIIVVLSHRPAGDIESGDKPGQTPYSSTCLDNETVLLSAPAGSGALRFERWEDDEGTALGSDRTLSVTLDVDRTVWAVYAPPRGALFRFK